MPHIVVLGWRATKPISSIGLFLRFLLNKKWLIIEYHIHVRQVSPHLRNISNGEINELTNNPYIYKIVDVIPYWMWLVNTVLEKG